MFEKEPVPVGGKLCMAVRPRIWWFQLWKDNPEADGQLSLLLLIALDVGAAWEKVGHQGGQYMLITSATLNDAWNPLCLVQDLLWSYKKQWLFGHITHSFISFQKVQHLKGRSPEGKAFWHEVSVSKLNLPSAHLELSKSSSGCSEGQLWPIGSDLLHGLFLLVVTSIRSFVRIPRSRTGNSQVMLWGVSEAPVCELVNGDSLATPLRTHMWVTSFHSLALSSTHPSTHPSTHL